MATHNNRPLSPHLQVYRLPLTGIISITHRATGVFLTLGLLLIVYLLWTLTQGQENYSAMQKVMHLWPLQIILWGFIYALFFHLCHGIRHLIWDFGKSFDREILNRYALYELIASIVLTSSTYLYI